jgi:hypothetical protein
VFDHVFTVFWSWGDQAEVLGHIGRPKMEVCHLGTWFFDLNWGFLNQRGVVVEKVSKISKLSIGLALKLDESMGGLSQPRLFPFHLGVVPQFWQMLFMCYRDSLWAFFPIFRWLLDVCMDGKLFRGGILVGKRIDSWIEYYSLDRFSWILDRWCPWGLSLFREQVELNLWRNTCAELQGFLNSGNSDNGPPLRANRIERSKWALVIKIRRRAQKCISRSNCAVVWFWTKANTNPQPMWSSSDAINFDFLSARIVPFHPVSPPCMYSTVWLKGLKLKPHPSRSREDPSETLRYVQMRENKQGRWRNTINWVPFPELALR